MAGCAAEKPQFWGALQFFAIKRLVRLWFSVLAQPLQKNCFILN